MSEQPFYRLMGFIIDKRYRGYGIGSFVLEEVIKRIYCEYGARPIALGVQQDNIRAAKFYLKHGFERVNAMDEDDIYYIRYPR